LIDRTAALLEAPGVAPWVLFKLDGGIDHLLIDEAQDTNPEQWRIVAALAEEMHAGLGRGDGRRTLFVVGDEKQSIFSFQRADPREFARMRRHFQDRRTGAEGALTTVALNTSFRSGRAVLKAVDAVFARDVARRGLTADAAEVIRHIAHRRDDPGCVEIWPPIGPSPSDEEDAWTPPVTQRLEQDPGGRLAGLLAATIRGWIDDGLWLPSRKAPMEAGDVLVLVRTRNRFFNQLVRALKERRVPVAGLDRMVLRDQLAVKDLLAVAQVLLLPDDDLTLAAVLKSPFVGFDDDAVFALAHGRTGTLWRALGAGETAPARSAAQWLAGLMAAVDYLAPFELLTRLLTHPCPADPVSGRRALLTRLGAEAEDPVDELLTLACALEASGPATLERFVHLASTSDVQVKREFDQDGPGRLRIMTVHGAKGLQAPIVILPDTVSRPKGSTGLVWPPDGDGVPLWAPRRDREDGITAALRQRADLRQEEEYRRLLYVAMTRAEDRLVVAGFHGNARVGDDCWYRLCRDALEAHPDIERVAHAGFADPVLRLSFGDITRRAPPAAADTPLREPLPPWARTVPAPEPEPPHPLTPSRPEGEEPAALPPFQAGDAGRFRRGLVVHALLQALPELPESRREAAARRYLANPAHGLAAAEQAQVLAETLAVMADPAFAPVFGPGSRAEVPVAAVIAGKAVSGQIDRLVARPDAVLIVDYKTNRPPPPTPAEVPALYWRQMAAYRAAVGRIYGDRPVRCALLWTAGPRLMVLDGPGLDAHARDAGLV
ncbi:MAG: UvrD-helicase domain-containing protein, partial [Rhodospirillaceae bacterium]|nr:UvrD-helicase domain-containing protein [Rhodospirillaceae bacterium]